ncbi:MAG: sulfotransferase domain-containing protein [Pararhodobacter sp.]|nr:sulfotransferase domain-containing protein [Pararhodobacter sp.]
MTVMQDFKSLFVIGAPKAGTSTLARLLARHPEIFLDQDKEPKFFTDFAEQRWAGPGSDIFQTYLVSDPGAYEALYAKAPKGAWCIDASTDYLSNATARRRLSQWARNTPSKLICMLRDPIERAVSEYRHTLRDLLETESLARALELEDQRRQAGWQPLFRHIRRSHYHGDVSAYLDEFGDDLLLLDFAELNDQERLLRKIWRFLGIAPLAELPAEPSTEPAPGDLVENASHSYRSATLQRALRSPALIGAVRLLAPQPVRRWLRGRIERANRTRFEPGEDDLRRLYDALADDIQACLADSRLPCASWDLSRRLAANAQSLPPPPRPGAAGAASATGAAARAGRTEP